jgi:hypothetical protein
MLEFRLIGFAVDKSEMRVDAQSELTPEIVGA